MDYMDPEVRCPQNGRQTHSLTLSPAHKNTGEVTLMTWCSSWTSHLSYIFLALTRWNDITYCSAMTAAEHKSYFELTKDTPYLTLTGDLRGVYCEEFRENWLH